MGRRIPLLLLCGAAWPALAAPVVRSTAPAPGPVYVMAVKGAVDPAVARYIKEGLAAAAAAKAQLALITLDTPGGLLDSTREIVQDVIAAPFPVAVYTSPRGARATSAGLFLMMGADVSAMAPETHIGAAHPVSLGGGPQDSTGSVMADKATSDAAAYVRALAEETGRNAAWAERAVRESVSLTADEALAQKVVDVVAEDADHLLAQLQDTEVDKGDWTYTFDFAGAPRVPYEMSASLRFLHALANPNIAYVLLMIGIYALLYEFASPGVGFGGVTGLICLSLAFFALSVLPLNALGVSLLVAGLALMAADHLVGGHGFLLAGGGIMFILGSFLMYDRAEPYLRVSIPLIAGSAAAAAAFSAVVLKSAWAVRGMKPMLGREALIGRVAEMREGGLAFMDGQLWSVEGAGPFAPGEKVRVVDVDGIHLKIEKL